MYLTIHNTSTFLSFNHSVSVAVQVPSLTVMLSCLIDLHLYFIKFNVIREKKNNINKYAELWRPCLPFGIRVIWADHKNAPDAVLQSYLSFIPITTTMQEKIKKLNLNRPSKTRVQFIVMHFYSNNNKQSKIKRKEWNGTAFARLSEPEPSYCLVKFHHNQPNNM